ncbi:MAG: ABC transporter substrate-binding protein [Clostridium sp.]|jgi:peptide/nickel transport system substrate-binding protein|nr:ABC transporter substrate-binding protein [Clostridium sp.]
MNKKTVSRALALFLAAVMVFALAACGKTTDSPLVIAISELNGKFSPFTGESAYDIAVTDLVLGASLIDYDRLGELVYNGIEGETRSYNGTDYTYTGIADGSVTQNEDGTTVYHLKLREGVKFSDGKELTADDVIFTYYAFLDPSYTGSSTLYSIPIVGLAEYRQGLLATFDPIVDAIEAAGRDNTKASDKYTAAQYAAYWAAIDENWTASAQAITDYCVANYCNDSTIGYSGMSQTPDEILADEGLQVAFGMTMWGFGEIGEDGALTTADGASFDLTTTKPAIADYVKAMQAAYDNDYKEMTSAGEVDGTSGKTYEVVRQEVINSFAKENPDSIKRTVTNISGIKKLGTYELSVTTSEFAANAVYQIFGIQPAPLHYYGDTSKYDYDNDKFGFDYGNTDFMHASTESAPLGAGPYKFVKFENKIVYFEANENYYKGTPKIKNLQYKVTSDSDKIPGIQTGTLDISDPSVSLDRIAQIKEINGGELSGNVITYNAVKNLGYGYVGINAKTVSVGKDGSSEASKNLRKALATIFAVYRDLTVNSYYGETASVINYPISETSWAAPQRTDEGYEVAYSKDVDGKDIYTATMTEEEKYAAAETAALGYLEAAGYTIKDGKATAAPSGASLSYEVMIPGDGEGDHPSFLLLTKAKESLAKIGITLTINDLSDSSALWNALDAVTCQIWCAAWGSTLDPDIYQIYHSDGLHETGTGSNNYEISDPDLDEAIVESRTSADTSFRKEVLKEAMEIVLDWGVEVPVYQRENCEIFSTERINIDTLPGDMTTYYSYLKTIETLELK